jgi:alanine racemase
VRWISAPSANVRALCDLVAPAQVLAVVKANGYGHGAAPVARAVEAGAPWLGVARVEEGVQLRSRHRHARAVVVGAARVGRAAVVTHSITPVVYTEAGIDALAKAVASFGGKDRLSVHLKIDTGMHRVGCDPADALAARASTPAPSSTWPACARTSRWPTSPTTRTRDRSSRSSTPPSARRAAGHDPGIVHAANSAAALRCPSASRPRPHRHRRLRPPPGPSGDAPVAGPRSRCTAADDGARAGGRGASRTACAMS